MIKLYGDKKSGNCYKCSLIMTFLNIPFTWIDVDVVKVKNQGWPMELAPLNPNAQIPFIEIEPGLCLSESNAILHYMAHGTNWCPQDQLAFAQMQQWMFFEQYSHETALAVARYWLTVSGTAEKFAHLLPERQKAGHRALKVMDAHLKAQRLKLGPQSEAPSWFVGDAPTLADISLYPYTHVAHEGGFDLSLYPNIQRWLADFAALPGYVDMETARQNGLSA